MGGHDGRYLSARWSGGGSSVCSNLRMHAVRTNVCAGKGGVTEHGANKRGMDGCKELCGRARGSVTWNPSRRGVEGEQRLFEHAHGRVRTRVRRVHVRGQGGGVTWNPSRPGSWSCQLMNEPVPTHLQHAPKR